MARIVEHWTYEEMFSKADLVVIAKVISTREIGERAVLLDDIKVVGVATEFKSLLILKGIDKPTTFQLHHYKLLSRADENLVNGPDLVRIPSQPSAFLLFLIKERDGRYAPVTGQIDPAGLSGTRTPGFCRVTARESERNRRGVSLRISANFVDRSRKGSVLKRNRGVRRGQV